MTIGWLRVLVGTLHCSWSLIRVCVLCMFLCHRPCKFCLPGFFFFGSSVISSSWLSLPFLWASGSIRSSLLSSLCCTARSPMKCSSSRSSSSYSLKISKLLMISLESSSTFSNPWQSWKSCRYRFFQTPFMVTTVNSHQANHYFLWPFRCYSLSKIVRLFLIHHSPLQLDQKCDVNSIFWKLL